ncbi:MAG: hypothetical protein J2P21_04790 [Chloracidobacterium sp.]|nr:hypothetical protein [Chloracidobacterium sp.]
MEHKISDEAPEEPSEGTDPLESRRIAICKEANKAILIGFGIVLHLILVGFGVVGLSIALRSMLFIIGFAAIVEGVWLARPEI